MTPQYFLIIGFPKFNPLTATGMALCLNLVSDFKTDLAYTVTKQNFSRLCTFKCTQA
jgi:hypothetical protein